MIFNDVDKQNARATQISVHTNVRMHMMRAMASKSEKEIECERIGIVLWPLCNMHYHHHYHTTIIIVINTNTTVE